MRKLLLLVISAITAAALVTMAADDAARRKARYYYHEGSVQQALGNEPAAYEYYKKAYQADPGFEEAALAYGTRRLMVGTDTLQSPAELHRSLDMMRSYVDRYPDDIYESLYYGYVAGQLDTLPEAERVLERSIAIAPDMTSILLELSEAYARGNKLDKAVESISRYESSEGMNPQLTLRKVSYLLTAKDTAGAVAAVTRLVESAPSESSFTLLKGNVFDYIGLRDSALAYYRKAEELAPESSGPKLALAGYYKSIGDSTAYDAKIYDVLLTEDLDAAQKTELLANYLQNLINDKSETKRGDYLFEVLARQYPHDPQLNALAARYSAAKQDFKEAEEQISYALDMDPTNITYWGQLMTYQAVDRRPKEAMATYRRALKHITPDDNLRYYYANVAQQDSDFDTAAGVYIDMIREIDPKISVDSTVTLRDVRPDIKLDQLDQLSVLFTSLADTWHTAGRKADSYRSYDNAITLNPNNVLAKNNYAYFMALAGDDLDKALSLSEGTVTGENASNPTYLDTYAWINFLKGNLDTAADFQKRAIDALDPDDFQTPELYDHYGDILEKRGDIVEAAEAWRKSLEVAEKNEEANTPECAATRKKLAAAEARIKAGGIEPKQKPEPDTNPEPEPEQTTE